MHGELEDWRVTGVGETKFAMDQVGLSAQEALRAKERKAKEKDLTPAQLKAIQRKEAKEQRERDNFEERKMLALLAKKDEKCSFTLDKVETGDGPGALTVTGLNFKYTPRCHLARLRS